MISSRARQIRESIEDLNSQMASGYYWYRIPLQINLPLQWMLMSEVSWIHGSCKGWRTSASTCSFLVLTNIRRRTNSKCKSCK
ncbi:hypothetical protein COOONC_09875 [Cooperia oncophora]